MSSKTFRRNSIFYLIISILFFCNPGFSLTNEKDSIFSQAEIGVVKQHMFNNIATDKNVFTKVNKDKVIKSVPGAIIASPSNRSKNFSMDYVCHWVRDAAITTNEIVYLYNKSTIPTEKSKLKNYLVNYVKWVNAAQKQTSPAKINVLGEPKYNIDGTVWAGQWSRPQNDGPALRAITLINIADSLGERLDSNDKASAQAINIRKLFETDLDYVAKHWQEKSYSLWEEAYDRNFFTEMVQRKALLLGASYERQHDNIAKSNYYLLQAQGVDKLLIQHWNNSLGYYAEALNNQELKGGSINISILLAVLLGNTHELKDPFAPDSEKMLSTAFFIRSEFDRLYFINLKNSEAAPLIGRYLNDKYDGNRFIYGNPWFIATSTLAQFYYTVADRLLQKKQINITPFTIYFFKQIAPDINFKLNEAITANNNPQKYKAVINRLVQAGDDLLATVKFYSVCYNPNDCLHLSEQIDRASGQQVSANDLTWSYVSLLTALQTRLSLKTNNIIEKETYYEKNN